MYCITEAQVEYILNDIRRSGVEMEDLQLNLLDHICCIVEQEFKETDDFERFYRATLKRICNNDLREIEDETINLLTFKNYYFMKKAMMISGLASVTALIFGSFFKIMFWPGASALLFLGIVILGLVFLPLVAMLKSRETAQLNGKLTLIAGVVLGILFCAAVIFSVMHWPGRSNIWLSLVAFSLFVFTPIYFFNGIRNPERRMTTMITTVLLVGVSCLQFTMIGLRTPSPMLPMYTYLNNNQILKNLQQGDINGAKGQQVEDKTVHEINTLCELLKGLMLERDIEMKAIPADFEQQHIVLSEHIADLNANSNAYKVLTLLKEKIQMYNAANTNATSRLSLQHTIVTTPENELRHITNLFVLNSVTQLQIQLAMAEKSAAATTTAMK